MAVKTYEGDGIVVHWDADRCEHSTNCVRGLPEVFDVDRRPWVDASRATAADVAATVDTCPSRALTYTLAAGRPVRAGSNLRTEADDPPPTTADGGAAPDDAEVGVRVTPRRDGPLVVEGPITLVDEDGTHERTQQLFLCRCGGSATKPRCDGTHKRIGFTADGVTPGSRRPG